MESTIVGVQFSNGQNGARENRENVARQRVDEFVCGLEEGMADGTANWELLVANLCSEFGDPGTQIVAAWFDEVTDSDSPFAPQ